MAGSSYLLGQHRRNPVIMKQVISEPLIETLLEEEVEKEIKKLLENTIVVYNDDINTFDHVIECFVKYCGHAGDQAEQCALIVHNKGKCSVKSGPYDDLKPICEALLENGITAKIL